MLKPPSADQQSFPQISLDLIRRKSEHHEGELANLQEISLHQLNIEEINKCLQYNCRRLRILLMQNNQICRIQNLYKLKELRYLNLALNNVQVIENLSGCESLEKLDLTCNFVKSLDGLYALQDNYNLKELYLIGNPCTQLENYRLITIRLLSQLKQLDGREITNSERILAKQLPDSCIPAKPDCINSEDLILPSQVETTCDDIISPDTLTTHDPISRLKTARSMEAQRRQAHEEAEKSRSLKSPDENDLLKKMMLDPTPRFNKTTGKIMQRNHLDVDFQFTETKSHVSLNIKFTKFLDSSMIEVDVHEDWISVVVKKKALHLELPCRVVSSRVQCLRSQVTGHLLIEMLKESQIISHDDNDSRTVDSFTGYTIKSKYERMTESQTNQQRQEQLQLEKKKTKKESTVVFAKNLQSIKLTMKQTKSLPDDFVDDPDVPPLM